MSHPATAHPARSPGRSRRLGRVLAVMVAAALTLATYGTTSTQPATAQTPPTDLPGLTSPTSVQVNFTDVYTFARGSGGDLVVNRRLSGNWTGFQSLGGIVVGDPSAVSFNGGALVVYRGSDNFVYGIYVTGSSATPHTRIGNGLQTNGNPTLLERLGSYYVYARGLDNGGYVSRDGGAWQALGGVLTSEIAATNIGLDIYLFARGTDNAAYVNVGSSGTYRGWQQLPGLTITSDLSAVQGAGSVRQVAGAVFARGPDNALWMNTLRSGGWSGWTSLGGVLTSDPSAAPVLGSSDDRARVFVRGTDNGGYVINVRLLGPDQGFQSLGGVLTGNPVALEVPLPNQVPIPIEPQVYARGTDAGLYVNRLLGGGWTGWMGLGGSVS